MTKKLLHQLVAISYEGKELSKTKVDNIAHLLNRKDLRKYIQALKIREKELTVELAIPNNKNQEEYLKKFQPLFSDKKIRVTQDPNLLLGVRITDNDIVYDLSLQNRMNQIQQYVEENF
jgi:hypothetical protein